MQYRTPTSDTETNSNNHFADERPYELQPISPGSCVSELMRADLYVCKLSSILHPGCV